MSPWLATVRVEDSGKVIVGSLAAGEFQRWSFKLTTYLGEDEQLSGTVAECVQEERGLKRKPDGPLGRSRMLAPRVRFQCSSRSDSSMTCRLSA